MLGALEILFLALYTLYMEVSRLNHEVYLDFGALWFTSIILVMLVLVLKAQRVRPIHGLIWVTQRCNHTEGYCATQVVTI